MSNLTAPIRAGVIMAGGSGERFWPVSRRNYPKQLLRLTHPQDTLLDEASSRMGNILGADHTFIITGSHLVDAIRDAECGVPTQNILAEPCKRNTAGALVYAAAALLARYDVSPDQITMAVVTADHAIGQPKRFRDCVNTAASLAERDQALVTMGIAPTRPETGYGYIQAETAMESLDAPTGAVLAGAVKAFHEKPNEATASEYVAHGDYYWNSGMFYWTVGAMLRELEQHAPAHHKATLAIAEAMRAQDEVAATAAFEALDDISIDYALMENADRVLMVRADFPWDDVGEWSALDRTQEQDAQGNVVVGEAILKDVKNSIIYNSPGHEHMAVGVVGMDGVAVIVTEDAVLVVPKDQAQRVKEIVTDLKERDAKQL